MQVGCVAENRCRKPWRQNPRWLAWLLLWAPVLTSPVKDHPNIRAEYWRPLIQQHQTAGGLCQVPSVGYKIIFVVQNRSKAKSKYRIWNLGRSLAFRFCLMDWSEVPLHWGAMGCACDFSLWLRAFWHIMQSFWQRLLVGIAPFTLESLSHWNKQSLRLPPLSALWKSFIFWQAELLANI